MGLDREDKAVDEIQLTPTEEIESIRVLAKARDTRAIVTALALKDGYRFDSIKECEAFKANARLGFMGDPFKRAWVDSYPDSLILLDRVLVQAISAGYLGLIKYILEQEYEDTDIVTFQNDEIEALILQIAKISNSIHLKNKTYVFLLLTFSLEKIYKKIKEHETVINYIPKNLLSRVDLLYTYMHTKGIHLEQVLALHIPEVQGAMALCSSERYLPRNIYFLIATFFSPLLTGTNEVQDLFTKMRVESRLIDLMLDLHNFHQTGPITNIFDDERFQEVSKEVNGSEAYLDLNIYKEFQSLNEKGSYLNLVQSHIPFFQSRSTSVSVQDLRRQLIASEKSSSIPKEVIFNAKKCLDLIDKLQGATLAELEPIIDDLSEALERFIKGLKGRTKLDTPIEKVRELSEATIIKFQELKSTVSKGAGIK